MTTDSLKEIHSIERLLIESANSECTLGNETQTLSDNEINEKYLKGEVRIVTEQARYPLETIPKLFSHANYYLTPDFQRRHRWNDGRKSRLIESFIMNVPIPPIFLYETDFNKYEVMDGLQRITAIKDFYKDSFSLQELEYWPELNGRKYSTLPEQIKKGIDRRYLSSVILLKETAKTREDEDKLKQLVFERINSGGVKLEYQESRNALYPSDFNKYIVKLSRYDKFCDIFNIPSRTIDEDLENDRIGEELLNNRTFSSMKDVEIVLRFFALRCMDSWKDGLSLNKFLDLFAKNAKRINGDSRMKLLGEMFKESIDLSYAIYGEYTFCMWKKMKSTSVFKWTNEPNMVIYDPIMQVVSNHLQDNEKIITNKDAIFQKTKELFENEPTLFNGRNTNVTYIKTRKEHFEKIISDCL